MKIGLFVQLREQGFVSRVPKGSLMDMGVVSKVLEIMREQRMVLKDVGVDTQALAFVYFPNMPSVWLPPFPFLITSTSFSRMP